MLAMEHSCLMSVNSSGVLVNITYTVCRSAIIGVEAEVEAACKI